MEKGNLLYLVVAELLVGIVPEGSEVEFLLIIVVLVLICKK